MSDVRVNGVDQSSDQRGERELAPGATLLDVVSDVRRDVVALEFPLGIPGAAKALSSRARLVSQLDGHLVPRLRMLSTPAVVVVAGSTGAGKSTIVNSLLGTEVSPASVLRPTTREPVLAVHPADGELLADSTILGTVRTVSHERVPRGLAILDAPDLASLLSSNRETAERLLDAADLWLFVTTAARYGDALPWAALERAKERGASVALVLNRVSAERLSPIRLDLIDRLKEHGMDNVPLFIVPDAGPHEGLLAPLVVAPIGRWLHTLAGADHARTIILRTLRGSIAALRPWLSGLARAVEEQADAADTMREAVLGAVPTGFTQFQATVAAESLAAGALEARWAQILQRDPALAKLSIGRRPRPSQRAGRRRDVVLGELVTDVRQVAMASLRSAAQASEAAISAALSGPGAPEGGTHLLAECSGDVAAHRERAVTEAISGWIAHARQSIENLVHGANADADGRAHPGAALAVRGLGENGFLALILAATTGIVSAHRIADALLGPRAGTLVADLRADLERQAQHAIRAEGEPYARYLSASALADDAVIGLRLRLAELKSAAR